MRNINIIFLVSVSVLYCASFSYSGTETGKALTMTEFIKTAGNDRTVINQKEISDYLDTAPESTPYLNRVEFRTETDEFDLDRQKYGIRFSPKGWGETRYSRLVSEASKASCRTEYDAGYHAALKDRYMLILEYLETVELASLKEKLAMVCEDRISVLKKKISGSISFDISDLVGAEELLTRLKLELVALENKKTGILHKIGVASGSKSGINFINEPLVKVGSVKRAVNQSKTTLNAENINLEYRKNKVELAMNRYNLEVAKSMDYISFLEVSYDHENSGDPEKAYAVELGIKLPFINSDQEKITGRKVDYMKERLAYEEEMQNFSEKMEAMTRSMDRMISQYEIIEQNSKHGNARQALSSSMKTGEADPLNILKIKEALLKSDINLVLAGYEIRNRFIDLLDISGRLSEKPFRNFLSEGEVAR